MKRLALIVALLAALPATAHAAVQLPVVDGYVGPLLRDGDTLYVGGAFNMMGRASGPLATFSAADGSVRRTFTQIAGHPVTGVSAPWNTPMIDVRALVADGAGGWYVGGRFGKVAGAPRSSLAHVRADGSLDPAFHADAIGTADLGRGEVEALALRDGTLFVGGDFDSVGGQSAHGLAAVDAATGAVRWTQDLGDGVVYALNLDGNRLYVGGRFGWHGSNVTAVDPATGEWAGWSSTVIHGEVDKLIARGDRVYAGGFFEAADSDDAFVALDAATGAELPLRIYATRVTDFAIDGNTIVVAGRWYWSEWGSVNAFDLTTGERKAWFGGVEGVGTAVAADSGRFYVAGITKASDGPRGGLAAFDASTGAALPWRPGLIGGRAKVLEVAGGEVALGGPLTVVDGVRRGNLAAVDLRTGAILPFDPEPYGYIPFSMDNYGQVAALAKRGDALWIAGEFNSPRKDVMAVDVRTGAQLPAPDWDARVLNMVLAGDTLFLGGDRYLRAFDAASGAPAGWDADPDDVIWGLAVSGSTLHVTGRFSRISGRLESGYAAFDLPTLAPSTTFTWGASSADVSNAVADGAGGVWLMGAFTYLKAGGGPYLVHLGADGRPRDDAPVANRSVGSISLGDPMYVSGQFDTLNGVARDRFAAVRNGTVTPFELQSDWYAPGAFVRMPDGSVIMGGRGAFSDAYSGNALVWFTPGETPAGGADSAGGGDPVGGSDPSGGTDPAGGTDPSGGGDPPGGGDRAIAGRAGASARPATRVVSPTARIVSVDGRRAIVRLRSPVARRVTVRIRLASTRAIVGRATVTLRANRTRNVRVSLSRRARHRKLVAEL